MKEYHIVIDRGENAKKTMLSRKSENAPTDKEIKEIVYKYIHVPPSQQSIEIRKNFIFVKCPDHNESFF